MAMGAVNGDDYLIWADTFGTFPSPGELSGDFNADGRVDGQDYFIWLDAFGDSGAASANRMTAVPQPTTLSLFALGLVVTALFPPRSIDPPNSLIVATPTNQEQKRCVYETA
ncbi:MAG: hypothetical protein R3C10_20830 [Pirellulales bacterium]